MLGPGLVDRFAFAVAVAAMAACGSPDGAPPETDAGPDAGGSRTCLDADGDGWGEGPGCLGDDCDEANAGRQSGCAADCVALPMDVGCPCEAPPGQPAACFGGDPALANVGACANGLTQCLDGRWTACFGQRLPREEDPHGHDEVDDDCNGFVDDRLCGEVDDCGGQCCGAADVCLGTSCGPPRPCAANGDCDDDTRCREGACIPYAIGETNPACEPFDHPVEPLDAFEPELQCEWLGDDELHDVMTPGLVIELDPAVDGALHPEIVFSAFVPGRWRTAARLVAIDGETCEERWRASEEEGDLQVEGPVAAGDVDGDGHVEIAAGTRSGGVALFDDKGRQLWRTDGHGTEEWSPVLIANLDAKGDAEILRSVTAYDSAGTVLWSAEEDAPSVSGQVAIVADVDLDGMQEVVTGNRILDGALGTEEQRFPLADGFPAVADFDESTPEPEIAVISPQGARIQTITGEVIFGPSGGVLGATFFGGPPVVADFDDDGEPEFGSAGGLRYVVFDPDCTNEWARDGSCVGGRDDGVLWEKVTQDFSSGVTGSSVFDFDSDGIAEVVYNDECFTRVYDGLTGDTRWIHPSSTATGFEFPVIADADGDGQTEIVVVSNDLPLLCHDDVETGERYPGPTFGVRVWRDVEDRWAPSRRIWNQHAYSVTNVREDGAIPERPENNWQVVGLNDFRVNTPDDPVSTARAVDLTVRAQPSDDDACPDAVTLHARVANRGMQRAPRSVPVAFFGIEPATLEELLVCETRTATDLVPGATEDVSCDWPHPPTVPWAVHVVVDSGDALVECDEDNNDATIDEASCRPVE